MANAPRTTAAIDADLVAVRAAKAQLAFAPPSADRATQRQTLEARERELVAEREVAAEEAAAAKIAGLHKNTRRSRVRSRRLSPRPRRHGSRIRLPISR